MIDRTAFADQIEIWGMKRVTPITLDQIADAKLVVPAGDEAARLREGLRGSVVEADLQSLAEREDGANLLTGHGMKDEAIAALEYAGLPTDMLAIIRGWDADEVAVHFVDVRSRGEDDAPVSRPIITKELLQRLGCETIEDSEEWFEERGGFDKARGDYDFRLSHDAWDSLTFAFRQLFHEDFERRIETSFVLDTCWYEDVIGLAKRPEIKAALTPQAEASLAILHERLAELGPA